MGTNVSRVSAAFPLSPNVACHQSTFFHQQSPSIISHPSLFADQSHRDASVRRRLPHAVKLAWEEGACVVVLGTGASERDGVLEGR